MTVTSAFVHFTQRTGTLAEKILNRMGDTVSIPELLHCPKCKSTIRFEKLKDLSRALESQVLLLCTNSECDYRKGPFNL